MGAIWLHRLPQHLESRGLRVQRYPGWELRSRSTGGFDRLLAIGTHHDAAPAGLSLERRVDYAWRGSSARPIGNMWLHTDGTIVMGTAGASNTQGKMLRSDNPIRVSKGVIDARWDTSFGNRNVISIEASNNGVGEVWPAAQLDAYEELLAGICSFADLDPLTDIIHHHEYTDRKIDPRGPTPSRPQWGGVAGIGNKWGDAVRFDVLDNLLDTGDDSVKTIDNRRIFDSRLDTPYSGDPAQPGQIMKFNTNLPATARIATVRVVSINPIDRGHVVAWGADGQPGTGGRPPASVHNFTPGQTDGSLFEVRLNPDKSFNVMFSATSHFHLDLSSWET